MQSESIASLSVELAEVKQLLLHLTQSQGLKPCTSASGTAAGEEGSSGVKSRVQLDLTEQEPPGVAAPAQQQQEQQEHQQQHQHQQQLQEQQVSPLLMLSKGLKPSLTDAVMLSRARHMEQEHAGAAQTLEAQHTSNQQDGVRQLQQPEQPSSALVQDCSAPSSTCDAAVHVSAQPIKQQQPACRELDMLTKRVHMQSAVEEDSQPAQQAPCTPHGTLSRCCIHALTAAKALLWDVALPGDYMLLAWDIIMLLIILYLCFALPYTVAFAIDFTDLSQPLAQLDLVTSCMFMCDCLFQFRVAFVGDNGKVEKRRSKIALHYVKGWFLFDIISSLPYEQMLQHDRWGVPTLVAILKVPRILRLAKMLRILKLLRMTRLTKLPTLLSRIEWLLNQPMVQLGCMCAVLCILLHWIACVWYYVATISPDGGWVGAKQLLDTSYSERYVSALYFAVSTVATVGFGDIVATTFREKIVALAAMLIGASVFGYFMGAMSLMVSATSSNRARMTAKRRAVDDFLAHRRVPRALADKVKSYFDYVIEREVQSDEADIIAGLSANLRTQVVLHLYQEALEKVPFFRGQHPQFITSIVQVLQLEYYAPGDTVVRQGEVGEAMYFLAQGSLEVRLYEDTLASALSTDNPPTAPRPACEQPGAAAEHSSSSSSNTTWLGRLLRRRGARAQQQQQQPAPFKAGTQSPWGLSTQGTFEDELEDRPYRHLGYLHPGEHFGEYSCLLGEERSATVVASSYVELYSLSRGDLEVVLQLWPELAEQFETMVQEAAGSLFPQPAGQQTPNSSPLARWNIAKAACHHQQASSSGSGANAGEAQMQQAGSPRGAPAAGGAAACVPAGNMPAQQPLQQQQKVPEPWSPSSDGSSGAVAFRSASSYTRPRLNFLGTTHASAFDSLPGSPRTRLSLAGQLLHQQSSLQHARSDPIAINTAVSDLHKESGNWALEVQRRSAAAGCAADTHQELQQQHQQQAQAQYSPTTTHSRIADPAHMSSSTASPGLFEAAMVDFPSLAARSDSSIISNMSGVPSVPAGRLLSSNALTRQSVPAVRASSMSSSLGRVSVPCGGGGGSGGSPGAGGAMFAAHDVARPAANIATRQGSGLFRSNSGHRHLFPGMQSHVLLPQQESEEEAPGGGGGGGGSAAATMNPRRRSSLTRHSRMST